MKHEAAQYRTLRQSAILEGGIRDREHHVKYHRPLRVNGMIGYATTCDRCYEGSVDQWLDER